MLFNQTFRNISRTREIIQILVKYGFEDIVSNSTLRNFVPESTRLTWLRQEKPVFEYTRWERIRMAAEELGPTFVKLAQVMSNRPDMLPAPLIEEFEKLQDKVPPFAYKKVREIIKKETKKEIEELFEYFDDEPLASASIGQVHKAKIKGGIDVVVKIQRPNIKETVLQDLSILREATTRADRYLKKQGVLNAQDIVKAFERSMLKELDYNSERRNIERFRIAYKKYEHMFYIPKVYREFSTEKVMVIEFANGCKITDVKKLKEWGLDPRKIAENGMEIYLTQIFQFGMFHADPHPGNVLVRRDGVICLIDFGMVGSLMPKDRMAFARVFVSLAQQDAKSMAVNLRKLAIEDEVEDMRALEYDLNDIIEDFSTLDVTESSIADMTARLQKVMFDYKIRVPGSTFLVFRAMAILEGIGKQIHPTFNTNEFVKPYGARILKEQLQPQNLFNEAIFRFEQIFSLVSGLPQDLRVILQKINKGKIHIEVELQGYGYLLKKMDSLTNRLSLTLVIVALIIGSSISMTADFPAEARGPYGLPYVSLIGISIAAGLCLVLVYATLRRRKYK